MPGVDIGCRSKSDIRDGVDTDYRGLWGSNRALWAEIGSSTQVYPM